MRLRGEVDLGAEYRGVRVSRRAWQEAASGGGSARRPSPRDESEEDSEGAVEAEEVAPRRLRPAVRRGGVQPSPLDAARAALDADAAALEQELAAVAASESAAADALRARAAEERLKAAAVSRQARLWESLLELRIRLQKPLRDAARLPAAPAARRALSAGAPEAAAALSALGREALATALQLDELLSGLLAAQGIARPRRRGGEPAGADALWAVLEEGAAAVAPFRDAAFDRWHAKTTLAASAAAGGQLRALNQPLSAQVAAALRDGNKARRRCAALRSTVPPRLCEPAAAAAAAAAAVSAAEAAAVVDAPDDERDLEIYEDGEFYAQLLRELMEAGNDGGGGAVVAAAPRAAKHRKEVDRRASKGRKLRYSVMPKLVNFCATPLTPPELPPMAEQLLARLWGRPVTPVAV